MAEVGRDLCWSSGPSPLLKWGHIEPIAQDHIQTAFVDIQRGRHHKLSGQSVTVVGQLHSKVFPDIQRKPLVLEFVPIASCPVTGHY